MGRPDCLNGIRLFDIVKVVWEDAAVAAHSWQSIAEVTEQYAEEGNAVIQSVGFVAVFTDHQVVLTSNYDQTNENLNGYTSIPYSNILKVSKLKEGR